MKVKGTNFNFIKSTNKNARNDFYRATKEVHFGFSKLKAFSQVF